MKKKKVREQVFTLDNGRIKRFTEPIENLVCPVSVRDKGIEVKVPQIKTEVILKKGKKNRK